MFSCTSSFLPFTTHFFREVNARSFCCHLFAQFAVFGLLELRNYDWHCWIMRWPLFSKNNNNEKKEQHRQHQGEHGGTWWQWLWWWWCHIFINVSIIIIIIIMVAVWPNLGYFMYYAKEKRYFSRTCWAILQYHYSILNLFCIVYKLQLYTSCMYIEMERFALRNSVMAMILLMKDINIIMITIIFINIITHIKHMRVMCIHIINDNDCVMCYVCLLPPPPPSLFLLLHFPISWQFN